MCHKDDTVKHSCTGTLLEVLNQFCSLFCWASSPYGTFQIFFTLLKVDCLCNPKIKLSVRAIYKHSVMRESLERAPIREVKNRDCNILYRTTLQSSFQSCGILKLYLLINENNKSGNTLNKSRLGGFLLKIHCMVDISCR